MNKKVYVAPALMVVAVSTEVICAISNTNVTGLGVSGNTSDAGITDAGARRDDWGDIW